MARITRPVTTATALVNIANFASAFLAPNQPSEIKKAAAYNCAAEIKNALDTLANSPSTDTSQYAYRLACAEVSEALTQAVDTMRRAPRPEEASDATPADLLVLEIRDGWSRTATIARLLASLPIDEQAQELARIVKLCEGRPEAYAHAARALTAWRVLETGPDSAQAKVREQFAQLEAQGANIRAIDKTERRTLRHAAKDGHADSLLSGADRDNAEALALFAAHAPHLISGVGYKMRSELENARARLGDRIAGNHGDPQNEALSILFGWDYVAGALSGTNEYHTPKAENWRAYRQEACRFAALYDVEHHKTKSAQAVLFLLDQDERKEKLAPWTEIGRVFGTSERYAADSAERVIENAKHRLARFGARVEKRKLVWEVKNNE